MNRYVQQVRSNQMQKGQGLSVDHYSHASRFVKNDVKLKRVFTVAGTELSSNCDVLVGPLGSWTALPFDTHGEISSDVSCGRINVVSFRSRHAEFWQIEYRGRITRLPSRLKSKSATGARQGASSAGTPSNGGTTWSHRQQRQWNSAALCEQTEMKDVVG